MRSCVCRWDKRVTYLHPQGYPKGGVKTPLTGEWIYPKVIPRLCTLWSDLCTPIIKAIE